MNKFIVFSLFVVSFFVSCGGGSDVLRITGSTTVLPVSLKCADDFMGYHPKTAVRVQGGGSGIGIADLINGKCEIANASRLPKETEISAARTKKIELIAAKVAIDGIVFIVNKENPISAISLQQAKDIYTGKITNWRQLGGKNKAIVLYGRSTVSGTHEMVKSLVLKGAAFKEGTLIAPSNKEILKAVRILPDAIGYIGIGYMMDDVKALKVDGVRPSQKTVKTGTYKISRGLYMITNGVPRNNARKFIDFVLSEEGQKIVRRVGYIQI